MRIHSHDVILSVLIDEDTKEIVELVKVNKNKKGEFVNLTTIWNKNQWDINHHESSIRFMNEEIVQALSE